MQYLIPSGIEAAKDPIVNVQRSLGGSYGI
jgi:hypothetical protein